MDKSTFLLILGFLLLVIGVQFLIKNESVLEHLMAFLDSIRDSGLTGWIILVTLSVAMNLAAIPMSIFDLSVGYIYPVPIAFATLFFIRFLSATGSFIIATSLCKDCAARTFAGKGGTFQKLKILVSHSPLKGGLMVSLAWIPVSVKMYGLSLAGMPYWRFVGVILAGSFPFTLSQVFYGSKMKQIMDVVSGKQQPQSLLEVVPGLIAIVALVGLVWKLTRNVDALVAEAQNKKDD